VDDDFEKAARQVAKASAPKKPAVSRKGKKA
jgi:hypothetical protein